MRIQGRWSTYPLAAPGACHWVVSMPCLRRLREQDATRARRVLPLVAQHVLHNQWAVPGIVGASDGDEMIEAGWRFWSEAWTAPSLGELEEAREYSRVLISRGDPAARLEGAAPMMQQLLDLVAEFEETVGDAAQALCPIEGGALESFADTLANVASKLDGALFP